MTSKYFFLLIFFFSANTLIAQHDHTDHHDQEHHDHSNHMHDHKNEIGIANAPVYFVKEKEIAYGLHFHYVRTIRESRFGIGLGYERIFDEHKHNTITLVSSYRPLDRFAVQLSPGITFEDNEPHVNFAYMWRLLMSLK
ncbi:MAG: hypothetical protein HKN92_07675 [Chitinophagales bacterium]|nr:hypothetical protein [Chitinophagales bacterium]